MKVFKRITAIVLVALFAFSPLTGGTLNLFGSAVDDIIESPILPIVPSDPEEELGLVYMFDDEKLTAKVIDFTDAAATSAVIPGEVKDGEKTYAVDTVGGAAFSAASQLRNVVIPETVETIEAFAFDACAKLENVWFEGDQDAFSRISIADGNDDLINARIYYGACMESTGPDFVHVYDDHKDAVCNVCGKARATGDDFISGDLDHDEEVTVEDAIYLLYHVNFSGKYPVTQDVDYDKSGKVDLEDVFYLLYSLNFPDRYPLN